MHFIFKPHFIFDSFLSQWKIICKQAKCNLKFVPKHKPCCQENLDIIQRFLDENEKILLLTGAGISTESGIPDYRSQDVGLYATSSRRPILYKVSIIVAFNFNNSLSLVNNL